MNPATLLYRFFSLVGRDLGQLARFHPSSRPWHLPVAAGLASGLPLYVGAWFDHMSYGGIASLGGMAFLYLPPTPLSHRMVAILAASFALSSSFTFGIISHFEPVLETPFMIAIATAAVMGCRFYRVGPPASVFFIMSAAIGAFMPVSVPDVPLYVGLMTMGSLLAILIAFAYSLVMLAIRPPVPVEPRPPATFGDIVLEPVVIGIAVGLALACAQLFGQVRPYWASITCLAVMQAASLRATWTRQIHRMIGTAIGLLLTFALLSLPLDKWSVSLVMMVLTVIIETMIVRHYALAMVFATPLAILLAEIASLGQGADMLAIEARFLDTLIGCGIGFAGGLFVHEPAIRRPIERALKAVIPRPLLPPDESEAGGE